MFLDAFNWYPKMETTMDFNPTNSDSHNGVANLIAVLRVCEQIQTTKENIEKSSRRHYRHVLTLAFISLLSIMFYQQKTILYRYKEPFRSLISGPNSGQIACGEPGGTRTLDTKLKRLVL